MEQKIEVDRLLKEFNAESSQEISEHLQQNLSSFVSLQKAFEKFFNQKTLNSFVAKQPFFVTKREIKLNTEEVSKDHTFEYVVILRKTQVLLSKEDILSSGETENHGLTCEFKGGLIYENNPLWTSSNKTIQITLYCDEFVCGNPLGDEVKKCTISALCFVLGNLPRKKRSMLSSINLAILCKTIFIEKYGYKSVQ